jgi:TDP-4-amino-4,6-dideoxy-D-glucose deaminase
LPENIDTILQLLDYINDINSQVDNGRGIDFLTLREDFGSVTEINDDVDKQVEGRKYHLEGLMTDKQREELIDVFKEFNERKDKECPDMHVDFGYAMVALGDGVLGKPLARVSGEQMRKSGYPQMSVAIDSSGDLFLYREAGFLDRPGNQKFTAGRIGDKSIEGTLQDFVNDRVEVDRKESDCRFMDSYDHLMTLLVNQTESDMEMGIQSPVRIEKEEQEGQISNNWYKD